MLQLLLSDRKRSRGLAWLFNLPRFKPVPICSEASMGGGRSTFTGALLAVSDSPGMVSWISRSGPIIKDLLMAGGRVTFTGALLAVKGAPD